MLSRKSRVGIGIAISAGAVSQAAFGGVHAVHVSGPAWRGQRSERRVRLERAERRRRPGERLRRKWNEGRDDARLLERQRRLGRPRDRATAPAAAIAP